MDYEVIVIGCGPAGLSAAIYLGRALIRTAVIGKKEESQLAKAHNIQNYYGFPDGIKGAELLELGIKQAKKFNVEVIDGEVVDAEQQEKRFLIKRADGSEYSAKILIIATGTPIKLSGITNEEELTGRGVHYCVDCDGPFYRGKKVAIIGNGNHAAKDAMKLSLFTQNISLISNDGTFEFSKAMEKGIRDHKIEQISGKVVEFTGKTRLEKIKLEDGRELEFDAVFMACGTANALNFASRLGLEIQDNILVVDKRNMTSMKGIFAAGNCAERCRQVSKNVGDGCNGALNAIKYLKAKDWYFDYGPKKEG